MIRNYSTKRQHSNRLNQGFTIVELLVVIAIIGILSSIAIVSYTGLSTKATDATLISDLRNAATQISMYETINGFKPTSLDENKCPSTPVADTTLCLKASKDNIITYAVYGQYYTISISDASHNEGYYINSENGVIMKGFIVY